MLTATFFVVFFLLYYIYTMQLVQYLEFVALIYTDWYNLLFQF